MEHLNLWSQGRPPTPPARSARWQHRFRCPRHQRRSRRSGHCL